MSFFEWSFMCLVGGLAVWLVQFVYDIEED